jgi:enamine deaminase RidA (YjgF/YER057c/UK114 family)
MSGTIDARLHELGIKLPKASSPAANYVPYVVSGNLLFVAGQITLWNGEIQYKGKLGRDLEVEDGYKAARICALNLLAQARAACGGDLDQIRRCVKVCGFVNAVPDFTGHPEVINGASDLLVEVFGDAGRHARIAVGAGSLPRNVAVEVDGLFEIG